MSILYECLLSNFFIQALSLSILIFFFNKKKKKKKQIKIY